jgi:outer membrane cobalamin receptor
VLAVLAFCTPSGLEAAATVTGTIQDPAGPLPGVAVLLQQQKKATDSEGRYTFEDVAPGPATLTVQLAGFRTQTRAIQVPDTGAVTEDFTLELDLLFSESLVVTGTLNPRTKQESSVAITTLTNEEIEEREPRNTADLLRVVPGFYVETSGGNVGNNLWARGLPADGSYRYVAIMEDGMPVFDTTELFFVNADIFVRVDENVHELEAIRGGNASCSAATRRAA